MARTPGYDENGRRKGTWTHEEDQRLSDFITKHGCKNWRIVPILAGLSRCGKSCRLRWLNYLKPGIRRGHFSKVEEETIIRLHGSLGNRWSAIAVQLPGRTDHEVKNYWHTYLKKRPFLPKKTSSVYYQDTNEIKEEPAIGHNYEPSNAPATISAEGFDVVQSLSSSGPETSTLNEPAASFSTVEAGSTVSCPEFDVSSTGTYCASPRGFWTEPFLTDTYFDSIFPTGCFSMSLYDEDPIDISAAYYDLVGWIV